jgi:hypothetical protein
MRVSDSSVGGEAANFTLGWTLVMASPQNQSQAGRAALAVLYQIYRYPPCASTRRCTMSNPAKIEGEYCALCSALMEGSLVYVIVRQQGNPSLTRGG